MIYGNGAAMGWSPDQVDRCSLWQMRVAVDGYNRANSADEKIPAPSDAEFDALLEGRHDV